MQLANTPQRGFRCIALLLSTVLLAACVVQPATQPTPHVTPTARVMPATLPAVTTDGARLLVNGQPFEIRGVNYIHPSDANMAKCPALQFGADGNCPWHLTPIKSDLDTLHALGVNTVRVFLDYYVFGGAQAADANYSTATPFKHLDAFIKAANDRGLYVIPVLMAKYPQDRFGPAAYSTALDLHVRPVVQHLAGNSGILAWDLFNEIDIGSPVDQRCWDWDNADFPLCFTLAQERLQFIKTIHAEVKRIDPQRLTTASLAFAKNYFEPDNAALRLADVVDVYTFHYYDNDPYDSGRYAAHWYYGKGFPADLQRALSELRALQPAKPIIVSELGFPTGTGALRTTNDLHRDLRTALATIRAEHANGIMLWPFQPQPDELIGDLFTK